MKPLIHPWLSFAAPLLVVLALVGLIQRQGRDRLQALPALVVGAGLSISGSISRRRHRQKLLEALHRSHSEEV